MHIYIYINILKYVHTYMDVNNGKESDNIEKI